MTDEKTAALIRALLEERASAEQRDRSDLVAQINDQLRRLGAEAATPVQKASRRKG